MGSTTSGGQGADIVTYKECISSLKGIFIIISTIPIPFT